MYNKQYVHERKSSDQSPSVNLSGIQVKSSEYGEKSQRAPKVAHNILQYRMSLIKKDEAIKITVYVHRVETFMNLYRVNK